MKSFGGHLTIEEFRQLSLTAACVTQQPPFISMPMVLETNTLQMSHQIRGLRRPVNDTEHAEKKETETMAVDHRQTGVCAGLQDGGLYQKYMETRMATEGKESFGHVLAGGGNKNNKPKKASLKKYACADNNNDTCSASLPALNQRGSGSACSSSTSTLNKQEAANKTSKRKLAEAEGNNGIAYTVTPLDTKRIGHLKAERFGIETQQIHVNWGKKARRSRTPSVTTSTSQQRSLRHFKIK